MEVGVFSKCIKELILDHDTVEVPGLGVFYAQRIPASFSDHRTTLNPPSRKMYFRKSDVPSASGAMLLERIGEEMSVSGPQAEVELNWCLSRIRSELESNRICILPGLGTMRSTSQSDYFFVSDDDLDIFPDGFGLEPVQIKQMTESRKPTRAERRGCRLPKPKVTGRKWPLAVRILLGGLAFIALAVGILLIFFPETAAEFGSVLNNWMDSLLYSEEELQLLGR